MTDPTRLLAPESTASDALQTLLRSSQLDAPSPADLERLRSRLPAFELSSAPAETQAAAGSKLTIKTLVIGLMTTAVVAIVAVVLVLGVGRADERDTASSRVVPAQPAPAIAPAVPVEAAPVAPPSPAEIPAVPTRPPTITKPAPPKRPAGIDETTLLDHAHRALQAGEASKSLRLVADHERSFPEGAMSEEREAIAIEALHKLGRGDEARQRLDSFVVWYPRSPYVRRLAALVSPTTE